MSGKSKVKCIRGLLAATGFSLMLGTCIPFVPIISAQVMVPATAPQPARPQAPAQAQAQAQAQAHRTQTEPEIANPPCLYVRNIKRTDIIDDWTVLLMTWDNTYYRSDIKYRCDGLGSAKGFTYSAQHGQICAGREYLRIVSSGTECRIDQFTKITQQEAAGLLLEEIVSPGKAKGLVY